MRMTVTGVELLTEQTRITLRSPLTVGHETVAYVYVPLSKAGEYHLHQQWDLVPGAVVPANLGLVADLTAAVQRAERGTLGKVVGYEYSDEKQAPGVEGVENSPRTLSDEELGEVWPTGPSQSQ